MSSNSTMYDIDLYEDTSVTIYLEYGTVLVGYKKHFVVRVIELFTMDDSDEEFGEEDDIYVEFSIDTLQEITSIQHEVRQDIQNKLPNKYKLNDEIILYVRKSIESEDFIICLRDIRTRHSVNMNEKTYNKLTGRYGQIIDDYDELMS